LMDAVVTKVCVKCCEARPLEKFPPVGLWCKPCLNDRHRARRAAWTPERREAESAASTARSRSVIKALLPIEIRKAMKRAEGERRRERKTGMTKEQRQAVAALAVADRRAARAHRQKRRETEHELLVEEKPWLNPRLSDTEVRIEVSAR
jgi:hypothetical protein